MADRKAFAELVKRQLASLPWQSAQQLALAVQRGEMSAAEMCQASLERIAGLDEHLHAFLSLDRAGLTNSVEALSAAPNLGELGLAGVTVAVKDNICTRNVPTTCGSKMLQGFISPFEATAVSRLRGAGAMVVGKTNLDEFSMGSSTENSCFGPTRNPWDLSLVSGGSSGGSAAAVAAGMVVAALGTDTGGSIRQPAAFCGVTGFRPTYGTVSRHGLIAMASSLDQIGVVARCASDCALVYGIIAGPDNMDTTVGENPKVWTDTPSEVLSGLRLGVPRQYLENLEPGIAQSFSEILQLLQGLGCRLVEVDLPAPSRTLALYHLLVSAQAYSNLSRYDGLRYGGAIEGSSLPGSLGADWVGKLRWEGFNQEVKRRICLGQLVLSSNLYSQLFQQQTNFEQQYARVFSQVDGLISPATAGLPFKLGEHTQSASSMHNSDMLLVGASLAGLPAISVPMPPSHGLPTGLHWVAKRYADWQLLSWAADYQRHTNWHQQIALMADWGRPQ